MNSLIYKTISANSATVNKQWVVIDVKDIPLGRASSIIANFLRGKYKTNFTPHVDCGDNVVVLNAAKIKLSGNKWEQKKYRDKKLEFSPIFKKAIDFYRKKDLKNCYKQLKIYEKAVKKDPILNLYLERCKS